MHKVFAWMTVALAACTATPSPPSAAASASADALHAGDAGTADATLADTLPDSAVTADTKSDALSKPDAKPAGKSDAGPKPDTAAPCTLPGQWGVGGTGIVQKISHATVTQGKVTVDGKEVIDGCDLDGDGTPDNFMGKVAGLYKDANSLLDQAIAKGDVVLLLDSPGFQGEGKPFDLRVLAGQAGPQPCDLQSADADCAYQVRTKSYDTKAAPGPCPAWSHVDGAVQLAGQVGATSGVVLSEVAGGGVVRLLVLKMSATVTGGTTQGRLCGGIPVLDLAAATAKLPGGGTAAGPIQPTTDCDGDGVLDCLSFSFDFQTVPGHVTGLVP